MAYTLDTPRVIINEVNAFPNSVVAVATAVPAFIGYTKRADYKGKSYLNKPVKISSLTEFLIFFGASPDPGSPLPQYEPIYLPVLSTGTGEVTDRREAV